MYWNCETRTQDRVNYWQVLRPGGVLVLVDFRNKKTNKNNVNSTSFVPCCLAVEQGWAINFVYPTKHVLLPHKISSL